MKTNLVAFMIALFVLATVLFLMTENGIYIAGAILFFVQAVALVAFGFYLGQNSFEKGHKMSLEAQRVNDEWDVRKNESQTRFAVELLKTVKSLNGNSSDNVLPPFLDSSETIDAESRFLPSQLSGFDDE